MSKERIYIFFGPLCIKKEQSIAHATTQFTDDFISGSFHSENVLSQPNSTPVFRDCPHCHLFHAILQSRIFTCRVRLVPHNADVNRKLRNFTRIS